MPICARAIQQPDGSFLLGLDPSVIDVSTCPFVVQTATESANSFLSISAQDGLTISYAIFACWAVAWAFKSLITTLQDDHNEQKSQ